MDLNDERLPPPPKEQAQELPPQLPEHEVIVQVQAIHDFYPTKGGFLIFEEGDVIDVVQKSKLKNGWWKGECRGIMGLFPPNHCSEPLPPLPTPTKSLNKKRKRPAIISTPVAEEPKKKSHKAKKGDDYIKRPRSGYVYFCEANRDKAREKLLIEQPDAKPKDVIKKLGELWRELPKEGKVPYEERSKKDRDRYLSEKEGKNVTARLAPPKKLKMEETLDVAISPVASAPVSADDEEDDNIEEEDDDSLALGDEIDEEDVEEDDDELDEVMDRGKKPVRALIPDDDDDDDDDDEGSGLSDSGL